MLHLRLQAAFELKTNSIYNKLQMPIKILSQGDAPKLMKPMWPRMPKTIQRAKVTAKELGHKVAAQIWWDIVIIQNE